MAKRNTQPARDDSISFFLLATRERLPDAECSVVLPCAQVTQAAEGDPGRALGQPEHTQHVLKTRTALSVLA